MDVTMQAAQTERLGKVEWDQGNTVINFGAHGRRHTEAACSLLRTTSTNVFICVESSGTVVTGVNYIICKWNVIWDTNNVALDLT